MRIFGMVPHSQLIQEGPKFPVQTVAFRIICEAGCRGAPDPAGWSVYYTRGEVLRCIKDWEGQQWLQL